MPVILLRLKNSLKLTDVLCEGIQANMKKNNLLKLLGIAFVVAVVATGVFYGLFVTKLSSSTGSGKTLVIAARALKPGTVIKAEDVRTIPWASEQVPKGTFETPADVSGKTVFDPIGD